MFLFLTLNWSESYYLSFKQDKYQLTTKGLHSVVSVCVSYWQQQWQWWWQQQQQQPGGGGGGGDVI